MDENNQTKERPRFWMWGDPTTIRNPIREQWEAAQKEKARKQLERFLKSKEAGNGKENEPR